MESDFRRKVGSAFAKAPFGREFRMLSGGYAAEDFGNAIVVLESEDYSIRFVRDRGQVFIDLASPSDPGNWHGLGRVLVALSGQPGEEIWSGAIDLDEGVSTIEAQHHRLVEALGPSHYSRTLAEIERLGRIAKERWLRRSQRSGSE
jgi:hypothetical protein